MKVRVRFTRLGKVRFTGHRDVARIWERSLRKASVPVAYSAGFSPRPRVSFGLALPTGAESLAEYLDIAVDGEVELEQFAELLHASLPPGFAVAAVAGIEKSDPSLQEDVVACAWEIVLRGLTTAEVAGRVTELLAADELLLERERKGERRIDDLRPAIVDLSVRDSDDGPVLFADLATRPRGMRPSELLAVAFPEVADQDELPGRILRTHQWIERDGARRELLPLDAADVALADAVRA